MSTSCSCGNEQCSAVSCAVFELWISIKQSHEVWPRGFPCLNKSAQLCLHHGVISHPIVLRYTGFSGYECDSAVQVVNECLHCEAGELWVRLIADQWALWFLHDYC